MSKGRNTAVVGLRLPDDVVRRLKALSRKRRQTMSELLKPVIADFSVRGYVPGMTDVVDYSSFDEIEKGSSVEGRVAQEDDSNVSAGVEPEPAQIAPSSSPVSCDTTSCRCERSQPMGDDSNVSPDVQPEPARIVASPWKEKYPGTPLNWQCPCRSGRKYKECCGPKPL